MVNYHILNYMGGSIISAKNESTGELVYMGLENEWEKSMEIAPFDSYGDAYVKMNELMKNEKPKYEARVTAVIVNKTGEPIFSETATKIEIDDEGGGEFLKISQDDRYIQITPDEWPEIKSQIDKMILQCREVKP